MLWQVVAAVRQNPAKLFAMLAGMAFVVLLGTFVAQMVIAIVYEASCHAQKPEELLYNPSSDEGAYDLLI